MTLFCFFLIDKPFVRLTRKKREDPNKTGEITLILQRYKRKKKKKRETEYSSYMATNWTTWKKQTHF